MFRVVVLEAIAATRAFKFFIMFKQAARLQAPSQVAEGDLVEAERLLAASADATRPERRVPKMNIQRRFDAFRAFEPGDPCPAFGASDWSRPGGTTISSLHSGMNKTGKTHAPWPCFAGEHWIILGQSCHFVVESRNFFMPQNLMMLQASRS